MEEYASKDSVIRLYSRLEKAESEIADIREKQAVVATLVDTLKSMPALFSKLQLTLADVSNNLKTVEETVDKTNVKIDRIETNLTNEIGRVKNQVNENSEKGKIDIVKWLASKWFEIVLGIATVGLLIETLLSKVG